MVITGNGAVLSSLPVDRCEIIPVRKAAKGNSSSSCGNHSRCKSTAAVSPVKAPPCNEQRQFPRDSKQRVSM